jgi:hypothetical protein
MRPILRTSSIWALSALFGCISLLGQGLHLVAGHAHPQRQSAAFIASLGNASCGQLSALDDESDEHDCAICEFLAQAQWNVGFELPSDATFNCQAILPLPHSPLLAFVGVFNGRAPPSLLMD